MRDKRIPCHLSHYATVVEAREDAEIYQLGDEDCPDCLARMSNKHAALAEIFYGRQTSQKPSEPAAALCHECSEMVEIVDGKLAPHHGTSGNGCPQNSEAVQIYLHPRVVSKLVDLEVALVFESRPHQTATRKRR